MDRMAQHTKQPEILRELFAALDNDPFAIAECLARPTLIGRLQFAKAEGREEPLESSSARAQDQMPDMIAVANANYTLPAISGQPNDCTDDTWTATRTTNAPMRRSGHTAVWTGTEMIVWGGGLDTGGIYTPSTDSWRNTSTTNAPTARSGHRAVWSGTEMIVWGGGGYTDTTGGRYNPVTDSWTATSTTGAPTGRDSHVAVWTGTEMIVWGGFGQVGQTFKYLKTGGRYNPDTDSWTATSTTNAPDRRGGHVAVWTGTEMIVWGGDKGLYNEIFNSGGRYNPVTDSWIATAINNAPDRRIDSEVVWTGNEMIIWGGWNDSGPPSLNTGGRYNPSTDSWVATSLTGAPSARYNHTQVWTGSEMIVWGGSTAYRSGYFNTGGRYDPAADSWTATSTYKAPTPRNGHTAVWTGSEMIVWGGEIETFEVVNTGGRYCAQAGSPTITLDASKRNMEETNTVRLKWSGATSTDIDVYRDGTLIATTPNDDSYVDSTGDTGRARYTYQVCEAGTQVCSNEETVVFNH
jgi:N-acetylneuraminic acid mutarotase